MSEELATSVVAAESILLLMQEDIENKDYHPRPASCVSWKEQEPGAEDG